MSRLTWAAGSLTGVFVPDTRDRGHDIIIDGSLREDGGSQLCAPMQAASGQPWEQPGQHLLYGL